MAFSDATGPTLELSKDRAGKFVSNTGKCRTSTQSCKTAQAIHAELAWSGTATALDLVARNTSPVIALCRKLIEAGHDPDRPLEAFRGSTLCLRIRSIGEAAELEVSPRATGFVKGPTPFDQPH
jgi:hypothetical protein